MDMTNTRYGLWRHFLLLLLITAGVCIPEQARAQSTAFSYQGKLTENNVASSGNYDFQMAVYGVSSGGSPIGAVLTAEDVMVSGGIFTLYPDFGTGVFDGQPRWLEISVRAGNSTGSYTVLTPRQPVLTTPYAQRALFANAVPNGSIGVNQLAAGSVGTSQLVNGSITADKLATGVSAGSGSAPAGTLVGAFEDNAATLVANGYARVPGLFTEMGGWNQALNLTPAPQYMNYDAVWTGSDWFLLGQFDFSGSRAFGYGDASGYLPARFNPATGIWGQSNTNNGPSFMGFTPKLVAASGNIFVLGDVGGFGIPENVFCWRYNLAGNSWAIISTNGFGRYSSMLNASYIGAGTKLFAFGASSDGVPEEPLLAGLYDPATSTWTKYSAAQLPPLQVFNKPILGWTGADVIIYGGKSGFPGEYAGKKLNVANGTWSPMSVINGPYLPSDPDFISRPLWTGTELFVEGRTNSESFAPAYYLYNPQTDSWRRASMTGAPYSEFNPLNVMTAFWTGSEAGVVYVTDEGGAGKINVAFYNPQTDSWRTFSKTTPVPETMTPKLSDGLRSVWVNGEALLLGEYSSGGGAISSSTMIQRFTSPRFIYVYQKQ